MANKVRITLTLEEVSGRNIANAVRRAFADTDSLGEAGVVKGVKYLVKATKPDATLKHIRVWAAKNGYSLGKRGRIPAEVRAAFDAAN